ncbi:MAG: nucleoside deaminase [Bacteroidales bacterium]|nr:nucleoside deaminase [Bacteroidales bacterium]
MKNKESMTDNEKYMQLAIEKSIENVENGGGPFGAVIVKNGEVIAATSNSVTIDNDPTAHAEVNAIRQACRKLGTFDLSGCEIYASCEPCPMCLASIYWARIDKLYYANTKSDADKIGFSDNFIYEEFAKPESERSIKVVSMMRDEALEAFRKWEEKTDKTEY